MRYIGPEAMSLFQQPDIQEAQIFESETGPNEDSKNFHSLESEFSEPTCL